MSSTAEARTDEHFHIVQPWDGDILNRWDGFETDQALTIEVVGKAPRGARVSVNGTAAALQGDSFRCPLVLHELRNRTCAIGRLGRNHWEHTVGVLWDAGSRPRYRLSVDDNIEFLRDLGTRPGDYSSMFNHWYLAFWRRMHEEFGTKVHLNIYYRTVAGDFTLAQMPDKWKDEWQGNSDWLRLTFHALQDKPDRIYKDATYDQIARDFDLVVSEIRRFAGDAVLSATTTVHWAEAPRDACRALRDRGIRVLIGLFEPTPGAARSTGYYLSESLKAHIAERDCWHDEEMGLTFVACDAVLNALPLHDIEGHLDRQARNPHTAELMELLIHEQYFRRELPYYQPDVEQKVVRALRWVTERGYQPVFWSEGFLGNSRVDWPDG